MMKISYDKRRYAWCFMMALLTTLLVSCHERNLYQGDEEEKLDLENLFDFSTAQAVTLDVKYDLSAKSQLDFEIYTQNPLEETPAGSWAKKTSIHPVFTGRTLEGGQLTCTVNIAAATEKLYIYSPTAIAPTLVIGDIVNKQVVLVNPADVTVSPASKVLTRASTTGTYYDNWKLQDVTTDKKLGEWAADGAPLYLLPEKIELSVKLMETLNKLLPADDNMDATTFLYQTLTLKAEANVDMYFVSHADASRQNALAYYTFSGGHPTQAEINKSLTVIFPNLASTSLFKGSGVRLKYRDGDEMKENFPAGSTIGWVLLVDAYKNGHLESPCNALYSKKGFNLYHFTGSNATIYGDRPHMGAFRKDDVVVLSFEDQPWGSGKPANFRDDVFVLKANPITSLPDDIEDPDKSAKITADGIYAFEDNWPEKKDYDLNDVMVKFQTNVLYKKGARGGKVIGFDYTFDFLHSGATFQNAFGFQLNDYVLRDNIDTENTTILTDADFSGIGLDPALNIATFMVFNNGKTSANKKVTLKIRLKTPLELEYFYGTVCNPFIVVNGLNEEGRTEVHIRNYKPTAKANMGFFGTEDDKSDLGKKLYYVSNDSYPFALDVRTTAAFQIPEEGKAIEYTYPQFTEWAKSKGTDNKDWYLHPKAD